MGDKLVANINEIIKKIEKSNPKIATDLKQYVKDHSYGLVYEQNLPDAIRIYKKRPARGDTVNILADRGQKETARNHESWIVSDIENEKAHLKRNGETALVAVSDLVVLVSYKDVVYPGMKELDRIENGNPDDPFQVVINAENYHALEALGYAYSGKVDCIYIDPPYNTGANDWKYNNDYVDVSDQYRHSKWLSFMERRLRIAKQLLSSTGVLIVAIDDYEYSRLSMLLESLFPEYDINPVVIKHHPQGGASANISRTHEYAIFVVPRGQQLIHGYKTEGKDEEWSLMRGGTDRRNLRIGRPNSFYGIYVDHKTLKVIGVGPKLSVTDDYDADDSPEGCITIYPIGRDGTERVWRYERQSMEHHIQDGDIICSPRKTLKVIKHRDVKYEPVFSVLTSSRYNASTFGTNLISDIFDKDLRFSYPKSLYTVYDCLKFVVQDNPNALIIDFFAGSGTTLQATCLLNSEDNGNRRCICVTNNEVSSSEEKSMSKEGLRHDDKEWDKQGIAKYVTWPRTKCVIEGKTISGKPLPGKYGTDHEEYVLDKGAISISKETGDKIHEHVYYKRRIPDDGNIYNTKMSNGFKANAIFYELTYENLWPIKLDRAFNAIAPILWLHAGCQGPVIKKISSPYALTNYYGVLFDYGSANEFFDAVRSSSSLRVVFIVTDDQRRYTDAVKQLPSVEVKRLYESYLRTFEIYGEGMFD